MLAAPIPPFAVRDEMKANLSNIETQIPGMTARCVRVACASSRKCEQFLYAWQQDPGIWATSW